MCARRFLVPVATAAFGCALAAQPAPSTRTADAPLELFFAAGSLDDRAARDALGQISDRWRDGYAAIIIDIARFLPSPRPDPATDERLPPDVMDPDSGGGALAGRDAFRGASLRLPGVRVRLRLTSFLEKQTGQRFGDDLRAWRKWLWQRPPAPHADYAAFKGELYARIDPEFRSFFVNDPMTTIRLDEIDWGGVPVNGIPPLRAPKTITADSATWLRDSHIVFGVVVNGEARAYPKRILAWHEMALDRVGHVDLTIVYCTLCGTVIPYESVVAGRTLTFGTSGLLYRSNKLMFDEETRSLWSSLDGVPVLGPLVDSGLRLSFRSAETTTWGEWRREHPRTTVLSLDTGFERDYSEGAAYRAYFATDRLMFEVPARDSRLKNKAEVLVLRRESIGAGAVPVAIGVDMLKRRRLFTFEAGGKAFVVVTSRGGANRLYDRGVHSFVQGSRDWSVLDADGRHWMATSDALVSESGERLRRVPAHRAFWFGWYAQHPDTVLHR